MNSNTGAPRVSAVIINWNCYQDTLECVAALRQSTYPNLEIVVVDNASTDNSCAQVEQTIPGIVLIKSAKNLGWAGGSRLGADHAISHGALYVFLLNADAFVEPDTIANLVKIGESSPDVGLVSARIYFFKSRRFQHGGSEIDWDKCTTNELRQPEQVHGVAADRLWVWATALLVKTEVINKIGFYKEEYFCYAEDQEYSVRAHRAGYRIRIAPDAKVWHRCHEIDVGGRANLPVYFFFYTTRNDFCFYKQYTKNRFKFYTRYLAKVFAQVGHAQSQNQPQVVDAHLDGLYCGFKNIMGAWNKAIHMPAWIKKTILACPFFWSDLLGGRLANIGRGIGKRTGGKDQLQHVVFLRVLRPGCGWGGFEKQLLDYFQRVDYTSCRVTLVTNFDIHTPHIKAKGLPVQVALFPLENPAKPHMHPRELKKFLAALAPQAIVLAQGAYSDFVFSDFWTAFRVARGRLYSLEVLGAREPYAKSSRLHFGFVPGLCLWWYKEVFGHGLKGWLCRMTVTVGEDVRRRLVQWYHYPKHKTKTVYHGIDLTVYVPNDAKRQQGRSRFNIPASDKIIISTARLSPEKCIDRLIRAFDLLGIPGVWLLIVGDGPLRPALELQARQAANADRIKFLGFQDDIPSLLQMSDVFALPSDIEGLSNAMIEAMATGLVPVVTDVPGAHEVLKNGVNGFIVQKTEESLGQGLRCALELKVQDHQTMRQRAQEDVRQRFNVDKGARACLRLLEIPSVSGY